MKDKLQSIKAQLRATRSKIDALDEQKRIQAVDQPNDAIATQGEIETLRAEEEKLNHDVQLIEAFHTASFNAKVIEDRRAELHRQANHYRLKGDTKEAKRCTLEADSMALAYTEALGKRTKAYTTLIQAGLA